MIGNWSISCVVWLVDYAVRTLFEAKLLGNFSTPVPFNFVWTHRHTVGISHRHKCVLALRFPTPMTHDSFAFVYCSEERDQAWMWTWWWLVQFISWKMNFDFMHFICYSLLRLNSIIIKLFRFISVASWRACMG